MSEQLTARREDPPASRTAIRPAAPSALRQVARGSTINLAGTVVSAVATFGLTIVVTRGVPADRAGVFFSCTSLFVLAVIVGQLGTQTGLVYFIGRLRALGGTRGMMRAYLRTSMRPVMAFALLLGTGMAVFAPQLARLTNPDHVGIATADLRLLAFFIPLAGVEAVYLAASRGLGSMRANALVELIGRPVVQFMLVWVSVLVADSLLTWAWVLPFAPAALMAWWWWQRDIGKVARRSGQANGTRPTGTLATTGFWRFTGPRAATSVVQIVMQRFDIVLLGAMSGPVAAAVYTAATRFVVAGQMGNNAVSLAAQPALAASLATDDRAATQRIYQLSTAWLMAVTWPLFLLFAVFGKSLLAIFGSGYSEGSQVLLLLSLSMLVATGLGMVDMVVTMAGHSTWTLINALVALAVQLGLDIWLIPGHGVTGAAIGWAAAILVRNVVALVQIAVALRLHPFGTATGACALLNLVCFAGVPGLVRLGWDDSWTALVLATTIGSVLYLAGAWALRKPLGLHLLRRRPRAA
jgi:O-antigen/teichoic acid export membrane protein